MGAISRDRKAAQVGRDILIVPLFYDNSEGREFEARKARGQNLSKSLLPSRSDGAEIILVTVL